MAAQAFIGSYSDLFFWVTWYWMLFPVTSVLLTNILTGRDWQTQIPPWTPCASFLTTETQIIKDGIKYAGWAYWPNSTTTAVTKGCYAIALWYPGCVPIISRCHVDMATVINTKRWVINLYFLSSGKAQVVPRSTFLLSLWLLFGYQVIPCSVNKVMQKYCTTKKKVLSQPCIYWKCNISEQWKLFTEKCAFKNVSIPWHLVMR